MSQSGIATPTPEPAVTRTVVAGLGFAEAPRWHDGTLWFSDIAASTVNRLGADGRVEVVCKVPGQAAGIDWLPDGRLLVVAMHGRKVYRLDPDGLRVHADLSALVPADLNDMVVAADGTAYVGGLGYDAKTQPIVTTGMVMIRPDGTAEMQAGDLYRPNGAAITPDGRTLITAETRIGRVSSQPIGPDGRLGPRITMSEFPEGSWSDGLCLDAQGAVWVCDPVGRRLFHAGPDGAILRLIDFAPDQPLGCMLGGPDRKTLFVTLGPLHRPWDEAVRDPVSRIVAFEVPVAGAGRP